MLSRSSRLTSPADFQTALRRGRRAGSRLLVVHLACPDELGQAADLQLSTPRVGFVVSKAVGGATRRNLVKRRLRHLCRAHLDTLPDGSLLAVRALPAAAEATYADLDAELERALTRVLAPREAGASR